MAGCISRPFREPNSRAAVLLGLALAASAVGVAADKSADSAGAARVTAVRFWSLGDTTRIAIEVSGDFHFKSERLDKPDRLFFDIFGARPDMARHGVETIPVDDSIVKQMRVAETQPGVTRVVIDLKQAVGLSTSQLTNPSRLIVEVKTQYAKPKDADKPSPTVVSGGRSLPEPAPKAELPRTEVTDAAKPLSAQTKTGTQAEQAKTDKVRNGQPKTDRAKTDLAKTDLAKTAQAKADQTRAGQTNTNQPKTGKTKTDQTKTDQTKTDADATPRPPVQIASLPALSRPAPLAKVAPLNSSPLSASASALPTAIDSPIASDIDRPAADKSVVATLSSLPPEPIGVEPASSQPASDDVRRDDSKRDGVKNDVKEVLPAKRGSLGDRSLTRALGLKLGRIVIDPGHGGNDVGTHGPSGYYEKDLTLDVARRLAEIIRENMGSEVLLTRTDDEYVGLEERTRLANEKKADLFVSIHANSSPYRSAAGVETYVLSFTTSRTAMELASRENASSELGIHDLHDLLQKIALRDKVDESQELASRLQTSLSTLSTSSNKAAINRGVKKAPFVVLIGANMPSVLAEIGFLTNATDETLLRKPEHRQKIAEALYKGIASYADSLSQVIARKN
jgi:N-acetylmuramoyl-L-alanine amidase